MNKCHRASTYASDQHQLVADAEQRVGVFVEVVVDALLIVGQRPDDEERLEGHTTNNNDNNIGKGARTRIAPALAYPKVQDMEVGERRYRVQQRYERKVQRHDPATVLGVLDQEKQHTDPRNQAEHIADQHMALLEVLLAMIDRALQRVLDRSVGHWSGRASERGRGSD